MVRANLTVGRERWAPRRDKLVDGKKGIGILRSVLIFVSAVAFLLAGLNLAGNAIGVWDPLKPQGTDAGVAARPPSIQTPHVGDRGTGTRTLDPARQTPQLPVSGQLALIIAFASFGFALLLTVSSRSMKWMASRQFRVGPPSTSKVRARAPWLSELPTRNRGWRQARSALPHKGPEALPHTAAEVPAHRAPEAHPHTGPARSSVGIPAKTNGVRIPEHDFDPVRCGQCGYEAAQDDRFCAHCGASLGEARAPRSLVVMAAAETSGWEICEIECWHGYVRCDFYARGLMPAGDEEVGRSPLFWWRHRDPPPQEGSALIAHQALVDRLLADGWEPIGARRPWYAQRFRRSLDGSGAPVPEDVPALQPSPKLPGSL
jgi:hypothetical protein